MEPRAEPKGIHDGLGKLRELGWDPPWGFQGPFAHRDYRTIVLLQCKLAHRVYWTTVLTKGCFIARPYKAR